MARTWATDTNVSLPGGVPGNAEIEVDLGGFVFSTTGICHPLSLADSQDLISSLMSPVDLSSIKDFTE